MTTVELEGLDLAALISSRLCHDVISPVGAIVNGLEVLDEKDSEVPMAADPPPGISEVAGPHDGHVRSDRPESGGRLLGRAALRCNIENFHAPRLQ